MKKTYAEIVTEDRRLVLLRILHGTPGNASNHYVLRTALGSLGHKATSETVFNDIVWLGTQSLVLTEELDSDVLMATLTEMGEQVALGLVRAAGVARPLPGK